MDASAALERLRDISSQVGEAVVFDRQGTVLGSTVGDDRAAEIAHEARELLAAAEARSVGTSGEFAQLEVALQRGSVFVVRDGDRLVVATTPPDPTVGLVFYDLKSTLRELDERPAETPKPKRAGPKARAGEPKPRTAPKPKPRAEGGDAKP